MREIDETFAIIASYPCVIERAILRNDIDESIFEYDDEIAPYEREIMIIEQECKYL